MRFIRVVALAAVLAVVVLGQKDQQEPPKPATPPEQGAKNQAVKVHGHWVIQINNPDGSIASRREIENSLMPGGASALANFLTGQTVSGGWFLILSTLDCGQCNYFTIAQSAAACAWVAANPVFSVTGKNAINPCATSLTVSQNNGQVVLQGTSLPAGSNGGLSLFLPNAQSYILTCSSANTTAACETGSSWTASEFTSAFLGTNSNGVQVLAGQTVTLTVTFSFS